jgi:hypothetical protein
MIKSRRLKWTRYVASKGEEKCVQGMGEGLKDIRPRRRPECRLEDNIKTDFQWRGWEDVWSHATQNMATWKFFL